MKCVFCIHNNRFSSLFPAKKSIENLHILHVIVIIGVQGRNFHVYFDMELYQSTVFFFLMHVFSADKFLPIYTYFNKFGLNRIEINATEWNKNKAIKLMIKIAGSLYANVVIIVCFFSVYLWIYAFNDNWWVDVRNNIQELDWVERQSQRNI